MKKVTLTLTAIFLVAASAAIAETRLEHSAPYTASCIIDLPEGCCINGKYVCF